MSRRRGGSRRDPTSNAALANLKAGRPSYGQRLCDRITVARRRGDRRGAQRHTAALARLNGTSP